MTDKKVISQNQEAMLESIMQREVIADKERRYDAAMEIRNELVTACEKLGITYEIFYFRDYTVINYPEEN